MSKQIVALGKPAISSEQYPYPQVKKLFCGIDVGAETLAGAVLEPDRPSVQREFPNTATGHKALVGWLGKMRAQVRGSLGATRVYSRNLALTLEGPACVRAHDFA